MSVKPVDAVRAAVPRVLTLPVVRDAALRVEHVEVNAAPAARAESSSLDSDLQACFHWVDALRHRHEPLALFEHLLYFARARAEEPLRDGPVAVTPARSLVAPANRIGTTLPPQAAVVEL